MHTLDSILLIGATGGFGQIVCDVLSKRLADFRRVAIFHDTSRSTSSSKQDILTKYQNFGFEIVTGNGYSDPTVYTGFDCIVIMLGNHALHLQPTIIAAAISAGVRHFYPSEYGADLLVGDNWNQRYYRYKAQTRLFLEAKARDEVPDLGWTYFLVGRLAEWAVIGHFGVNNSKAEARIYGNPQGRQSLIAVEDAAEYLVASLKDPIADSGDQPALQETNGRKRTFRISSSSPTWEDIFGSLNKISGQEYKVEYLEVESALKEQAEALRDGDIEKELSASHKLVQGRQGTLLPQPWDNDRFPWIKPKTYEEALNEAFAIQKYRKMYGLQ